VVCRRDLLNPRNLCYRTDRGPTPVLGFILQQQGTGWKNRNFLYLVLRPSGPNHGALRLYCHQVRRHHGGTRFIENLSGPMSHGLASSHSASRAGAWVLTET